MWWLFTKKVQNHSVILEDETVSQACYGLGSGIVRAANRTVSRVNETWETPESDEGLALPINRTGIVALTSHRLLFFAKRFAFGRPGPLTAEWPVSLVANITYAEETLAIEFTGGSVASLHVPKSQSPDRLIAAFEATRNVTNAA